VEAVLPTNKKFNILKGKKKHERFSKSILNFPLELSNYAVLPCNKFRKAVPQTLHVPPVNHARQWNVSIKEHGPTL